MTIINDSPFSRQRLARGARHHLPNDAPQQALLTRWRCFTRSALHPTALATAAIASCLLAGLGGCQTSPPNDGPAAVGLRYYAPMQVVVIEADVTEQVDRHVTGELTIESTLKYKGTQATISLRTLPDTRQAYSLDISPGPGGQDSAAGDLQSLVSVSSDALLVSAASAAPASDDASRVQVVTDASHFPLAAAVVGPAPDRRGDANDLANPIETVFNMTDSGRRLRGPEHETTLLKFRQLPLPLLYFLQESQEGRELWDRGINLDGLLAEHLVERDALYDRVTSASAGVAHGHVPAEQAQRELDVNKAKLDAMSTEIESLRKQRDGVDAALHADIERLLADRQLGAVDHTTRYVVTLELPDLPPPTRLARCANEQDVLQTLQKSFPKACDAFRQTRIVVTLGNLLQPATDQAPAPFEIPSRKLSHGDASRPQKATIFYRQAAPAEIGVWAMVISPDAQNSQMAERLQRVDQESLAVLDPQAPASPFTFDPAALAARGLVLGFDTEDRFDGLTTPGSAMLTQGSRNAAARQQAQTEAQLRLQRTKTINQLEQQLHSLHRRADLLDCTIAMQSETVENAVLAQRAQLQEQIGQLQAKLEAIWSEAPPTPDAASPGQMAGETPPSPGDIRPTRSSSPQASAPNHASTMDVPVPSPVPSPVAPGPGRLNPASLPTASN